MSDDFLRNFQSNSDENDDAFTSISSDNINDLSQSGDINGNIDRNFVKAGEKLTNTSTPNDQRNYLDGGTSDSEYSSDEDDQLSEVKGEKQNERLFHDRWAVHSGVLQQKRPGGWNRRYCKIVDNCLKGFR